MQQIRMKNYRVLFIYLKGCETALKEAPPAAARKKLAHCCHKIREYRAMQNSPCTVELPDRPNEQVVAN